VLSDGNIVVASSGDNRIRLVTPLGVVTTLAGSGYAAFADDTGPAASFYQPFGVAVTSSGVIVVADLSNHRIRRITYPAGVVTTLAGQTTAGSADGTGAAASFNNPSGVAVTSSGDIIVADQYNHRIRLVTPLGVVTTLAGSGSPAFADGTGAAASFNYPAAVAVIPSSGVIVVADKDNHRIRLVTPTSGVVTTLAGSGSPAFADGTGAAASFYQPFGVAVTSSGDIIVADQSNHRIRLVTYPGGVVTTLAGSGSPAFANGTGVAASFSNPVGVAVTPTGEIVVGDQTNQRIRLIV
jgi:sugar lactone lactonase YvrE